MQSSNHETGVKQITVKVRRYGDRRDDTRAEYDEYQVPWSQGMSAMDALDYVYQNLDGSLAYYDHAACALGACGRCTARINGKPGLLCQTLVHGNLTLEPSGKGELLQDLVTHKASAGKGINHG